MKAHAKGHRDGCVVDTAFSVDETEGVERDEGFAMFSVDSVTDPVLGGGKRDENGMEADGRN